MEILETVNFVISLIFTICYTYQILYIPISLLGKKRKHKKCILHNYAVLICARNEERVIGGLLDSLNAQSYPADKLKVFVMADNCTDGTAKAAMEKGAFVYERRDDKLIGKGYALEELLVHIEEDHGAFDGYFVFDADNILESDYIEQMNKSFSDGYSIVTGYRNSKNYGANWISAGYALWFLRESKYLNQARWILGTSCAVSGTGFMFGRNIYEKAEGWKYHLLTEDIEFSVDMICRGERIGYCPEAVLYDEQPLKFRQSCRQRMRWAKGYLQVFRRYGTDMFKGILKADFSCFDMAMAIMPAFILSVIGFASNLVFALASAFGSGDFTVLAESLLSMAAGAYLLLFFIGAVTTLSEWKNIHCPNYKKILYSFSFPLFMFTYIPISVCAIFAKVTWKPIEHGLSDKGIDVGRKNRA
ncbi:MAG: glycosyltransferase [Ruminococcaceae bacterium]|nr:glycosyltransferase [Oscillospiraceae bacterium]